jgi:hypothetical protein
MTGASCVALGMLRGGLHHKQRANRAGSVNLEGMTTTPGPLLRGTQPTCCLRHVALVGAILAAAACAPYAPEPAPAPLTDSTSSCTEWRIEVLNRTEQRVYVYHVWHTEDRLGAVDPRQIAQFVVDSDTRPEIRIKLGHSWDPWAQREDVRIVVVCSGHPRP